MKVRVKMFLIGAVAFLSGMAIVLQVQHLTIGGSKGIEQGARTVDRGKKHEVRRLPRKRITGDVDKSSISGSLKLGKIVYGTDHKIIYNSVPKCGSRTFADTSNRLFKKRGYTNITRHQIKSILSDGNQTQMTEENFARLVRRTKSPAYFQGHGKFHPFYRQPQPIYINFIREPVSRMVSAFYFTRYGDQKLKMGFMTDERKNMTMEECIEGRKVQCTMAGRYLNIFCGYGERCATDTAWAMKRAKSNVERYYTFIGITEDYEASLKVLEHLLPDLYSGVVDVYNTPPDTGMGAREISKTKNKQPLSQALNDTAHEYLAVDCEFYNWVYDKLREQKERFGID